ncbi:helix-turn-helix domain-containing protein [Limnochorda pilosa]|uniref:HTH cro/C1-type domain-containing protein n=1 Tax=Limnochorda pilosa TaxID=1555112 RepID=A0A0K2SPF8_LIMPI|nr:helix-turn-helix transcriptional regulator [Limnochorda pilosa]BAS29010.1 hypothetical protein LIP_3187 [Limnochorda pilosa]
MSLSGSREGRTAPLWPTLGERIRTERQRLHMTQSELAGSEMTKSFISQVEANLTRPSLRSLQVIAKRLNRPVSYFLDEPEPQAAAEDVSGFHLIRQVRELAARGAPREALATVSRALEEAPPHARAYRARLLSVQAELFAGTGRLEEAAESYASASEEWRAVGDVREQAALLLAWARFERDRGTAPGRVVRLLEQAVDRLRDAPQDEWLLPMLLAELGLAYARLGSDGPAVEHLRAALHTLDDLTDFARYGEVAVTLGRLLERAGDHDAARLMIERGLHFFQALGDRSRLVEGYLHLAWQLGRSAQLHDAGRVMEEAARVAGDGATGAHLRSEVLRGRAWLEALGGREDAAESLWTEALHQEPDPIERAHAHRELARLFLRSGRVEQGRAHLHQALDLLEAAGSDNAPLGPFRQELAGLYRGSGQDDQAASLLAGALEWFRTKGGAAAWTGESHDLWLLDLPSS